MLINFALMSNAISGAFDSDYIDIYRQVEGSPERDLLYENVRCHIAIKSSDNPDPLSVDVQPIIKSLAIHMANWIDIQNNDYIVAKKTDTKGNVLHYYSGTVGYPSVSMARKSVNMIMNTLKQDEPITPTPIPEDEAGTVNIKFLNDVTSEEIRNKVTQKYKVGTDVTITPLEIENFEAVRAELNDEIQETTTIQINNIQKESYMINYYYNPTTNLTYIRPLVNGIFVKDDGKVSDGYHFYKKIPITGLINENTIKIPDIYINHEEEGEIVLRQGSIFIDNLGNWHIITSEPQELTDGYIIEFEDTEPFEAVITHWYD